MPFGLTNAPSTFQQQSWEAWTFSLPYIDDVIIFSTSFTEHLSHITSVLSRLAGAGLTVKQSKWSRCFRSFDFLGFHVGYGKLSIPGARIAHISNYVIPSTKSSLKSFLGLITFYSCFIPALSHYTAVLNSYLTKNSPDKLHYDNNFMIAFNYIISSVSSHTSLIIPNANDALSVFTDASYSGVGGSLCVYRDSTWITCAFYSPQLLSRENNYSVMPLPSCQPSLISISTNLDNFSRHSLITVPWLTLLMASLLQHIYADGSRHWQTITLSYVMWKVQQIQLQTPWSIQSWPSQEDQQQQHIPATIPPSSA